MKFSLSSLSAYARPEAHLTKQTLHGAVVTVLGVLLAATLFLHETTHFFSQRVTKMAVDVERRHDLQIALDVSFPSVPCAALSLDVVDASGTMESDVSSAKGFDLHKVRVNDHGTRIGKSEYYTPQSQQLVDTGSEMLMSVNLQAVSQHISEMEKEFEAHEGCRLYGSVLVRRVAGRMHFSVHQSGLFEVLPQMLTGHQVPRILNMSHVVHKLSFGPEFPGQVNPLDGFERIVAGGFKTYKYFVKVVPTEYFGARGAVTETHQYSVSEYATPMATTSRGVAAVDVMYDMSPIVVTINERPSSVLHLLVRICAVVGGAFAVTGMLDTWVHRFVGLLAGSGLLPQLSQDSRQGSLSEALGAKLASMASLGANSTPDSGPLAWSMQQGYGQQYSNGR